MAGGDVYIYRTARVMGKCCLSDSAVSRVTPPGHSPPAQHLALISSLVSCCHLHWNSDGCAFTLPACIERVDRFRERECGKKQYFFKTNQQNKAGDID